MIDTEKYEGHTEGPWRIVESDSGTGYGDGTYYLGLSGNALITELSFRSNEHESHPDVQLMADAPLILEDYKRLRDVLRDVKSDIDSYLNGGWNGDEGWEAISSIISALGIQTDMDLMMEESE